VSNNCTRCQMRENFCEHLRDAVDSPCCDRCSHLTERGRRLASERDDLIAQGVNPADLVIPLAPADPGAGEQKP
jgi:hypothetical protein